MTLVVTPFALDLILIQPIVSLMKPHPLRQLYDYARQYRRDFQLASLYSVLNKFFDILPEVLIGVAVDIVVNGEKSFMARKILAGFGITEVWHQLLILGALNAVIWIAESGFEYLLSVRWRKLAQNLQHDLRLDVYDHVQKLEMSYFENQRTGNLMSVLNEDINQMERFLNGGMNQIIQVVCSSILVGAVFFTLQPALTLIALLPIPAILFGAFWFQKRLEPRYRAVREAAGDVSAKLNNNLLGLATIKAYATETLEKQHIALASDAYRQTNRQAIAISAAITPVIRMGILAGFTATLVYGGWLTLQGELAVGAYSVLVYLTQRLLWPMTGLAEVADMYQRSMSAIQRAMDLLATPIQIQYQGQPLNASEVRGEIEFRQLSFSYEEQTTLSDINLHIGAGTSLALVGTTGSGKSSLIKLLLRFYQAQQGQILLDGHAISDFNLQDLRRVIGYVAQDSFLTDGSIAENIAYGMPEVSEEAIYQAAEAAEALEFIQQLPLGFATQVGERGQKLSGGQRQRIALARAILKNPPILILDEATAAVDNETEAAIQRSLDVISQNRTVILIAHRLSTIRHANQIVVMEQGKIIERGQHEQLIQQNGSYASLWRLQTGQRLTDAIPH